MIFLKSESILVRRDASLIPKVNLNLFCRYLPSDRKRLSGLTISNFLCHKSFLYFTHPVLTNGPGGKSLSWGQNQFCLSGLCESWLQDALIKNDFEPSQFWIKQLQYSPRISIWVNFFIRFCYDFCIQNPTKKYLYRNPWRILNFPYDPAF